MSGVADITITSMPYMSLQIRDQGIEYDFDFDAATDAQKALAIALFNSAVGYFNAGGLVLTESILMEFDRHNMRHLFIENVYL